MSEMTQRYLHRMMNPRLTLADEVAQAAVIWSDARIKVCSVSIKDSVYRQYVNELSEAEDALARAVEKMRNNNV